MTPKLLEKPPALRLKENIQQSETQHFFTFPFCASFCPSGSGSAFPTRMRIHLTKFNEDLDPQPIYVGTGTVPYRTSLDTKQYRTSRRYTY